ncbi:hypothetical protein M2341_001290 [Sphingobium sp. B7D2B]|uniref:hypothetical protein n=2 Tax=unclassified Sphingobium TaxID=2611147 RepID=UPI0022242C40|nr:hypothetical protein [Sphingobium sp. B7D2B]MCW2365843.1 hypothetical protein [Sphingobium sp. B7D2B]
MNRMKLAVVWACVLMIGTATFAQQPASPACDRTCLEGWVDRYLVAMRDAKVDPTLFAREAKFTENGIQLPLGDEGLWHSMSALGTYKFIVPDIETQQVAFLGTVRAENRDGKEDVIAIALRLKIRGDRITEIEQLASRPDDTNSSRNDIPPTGVGVEKMGRPHPLFTTPIPVAQRQTREELVRTANYYFTGLQRNDGRGYYPFTDDCIRFENGMDVLANALDPATGKRGRMTCKYQFEAALKNIVSRVRDRRFVAVDRERGIVFAFAFFDHERLNWTWQLGELFRIENGQIRRIEAIFHRAPYGINSGWSTYEQGLSDQIQDIR